MIHNNVKNILRSIPDHVRLMAVAKTRGAHEVEEAIEAGVHLIGENYVQEALPHYELTGHRVPFHFIGHMQRNKVRHAIGLFSMIETVDSLRLAEEISKRSETMEKTMDILIEINSGRESQKFGVIPEEAERLIRRIAELPAVRQRGLMTMGPFTGDPEEARPYFKETRQLFDLIRGLDLPNTTFDTLSMGMTDSYRIAIEEGATVVRIGTAIFGPRH